MFKNAALPLFAATFLLTGCFGEVESPDVSSVDPVEVEQSSGETTATPVAARPPLPEIFDCLREGSVLVGKPELLEGRGACERLRGGRGEKEGGVRGRAVRKGES